MSLRRRNCEQKTDVAVVVCSEERLRLALLLSKVILIHPELVIEFSVVAAKRVEATIEKPLLVGRWRRWRYWSLSLRRDWGGLHLRLKRQRGAAERSRLVRR